MVLPFILGAMAIGGAVSAVGGMMQANETNRGIEKANKIPLVEKSRGNLNLPKLVAESRKAGFNPLTVLRAGGVTGYATQTHTTTGHNAHLYAQRQSPGGALLGGIGNTISNVASAGLQSFQHNQSLQAAYSALPAFGAGGFGQGGGSGPAYGAAGRLGLPSSGDWTEEIPGVTNPLHEMFQWESNPYLSDTQSGFGERYGEPGEWAGGIITGVGDLGWNIARFGHYVESDLGPAFREQIGGAWNQLWGSHEQSIPSITVYGKPQ